MRNIVGADGHVASRCAMQAICWTWCCRALSGVHVYPILGVLWGSRGRGFPRWSFVGVEVLRSLSAVPQLSLDHLDDSFPLGVSVLLLWEKARGSSRRRCAGR